MPGLSKAEAAREMGISRTTLYKLIRQGKLSAHPDGTIDPTELVRAVSTLSTPVHRERSPVHREHIEVNTDTQRDEHLYSVQDEHREHPMDSPSGHRFTVQGEQVNTLQEMVTILREQLADARERERDHRAQIAQLTHMLDQSQQRYDRLLEAPAPTAAPAPASRPRWPADIHQRILDYMRTHPGPHSPSEVQDALELPNTLRHIMRHMADNDQLTRPAPGLYAYPDSDREE